MRLRRSTRFAATLSCTIRRRSVVQRCPAVPTAAKVIARVASSRSALGATIIALLPPSSRMARPKRSPTRAATARPIRVLPVALTTGTFLDCTSASPASRPPTSSAWSPSGAVPGCALPNSATACLNKASQASAVSGVFSDGFQTTLSPQTKASALFHAQTATGKLKAEITPTTPTGCQVSIIRWPGRSDAIVRPYSWRDRPTAKSQMSIISCTSPSPSDRIFPVSSVTRRPRAALCLRNSTPSKRTSSPRTGAGTPRHCRNAAWARSMAASLCSAEAGFTRPMMAPSMGERTVWPPATLAEPSMDRDDRMSETRMVVGGGSSDGAGAGNRKNRNAGAIRSPPRGPPGPPGT